LYVHEFSFNKKCVRTHQGLCEGVWFKKWAQDIPLCNYYFLLHKEFIETSKPTLDKPAHIPVSTETRTNAQNAFILNY
jgi:hypothetical protein